MFRVQMISGGVGAYQRDFDSETEAKDIARYLSGGKTTREVAPEVGEIFRTINRGGTVVRVITT